MTDNEIIKAYELCLSGTNCYKRNCPFLEKCDTENLGEYVLDLLKRQKAEIERLNGVIKNFKATKERLQAEIERLEKNLKEAFAEIEALNQINLHYKAEAVKEFAERFFKTLRKKGLKGYMFNFSFYYADDVEDSIKEVTKEMVGEG
jgi:chromosome segregation ATPase